MNHLVRQIADICDDAPDPNVTGTLGEFQRRLDAFDQGMTRILALAHHLQNVLDGKPHAHAAGTLEGLHIDTCANCGRDIRDEIHRGAG